jgi:hypothetical protein
MNFMLTNGFDRGEPSLLLSPTTCEKWKCSWCNLSGNLASAEEIDQLESSSDVG